MGGRYIDGQGIARIDVTIQGEQYSWHGPIEAIAWKREPIEQVGPSYFYELVPGRIVDVTLSFVAADLEQEPR